MRSQDRDLALPTKPSLQSILTTSYVAAWSQLYNKSPDEITFPSDTLPYPPSPFVDRGTTLISISWISASISVLKLILTRVCMRLGNLAPSEKNEYWPMEAIFLILFFCHFFDTAIFLHTAPRNWSVSGFMAGTLFDESVEFSKTKASNNFTTQPGQPFHMVLSSDQLACLTLYEIDFALPSPPFRSHDPSLASRGPLDYLTHPVHCSVSFVFPILWPGRT